MDETRVNNFGLHLQGEGKLCCRCTECYLHSADALAQLIDP